MAERGLSSSKGRRDQSCSAIYSVIHVGWDLHLLVICSQGIKITGEHEAYLQYLLSRRVYVCIIRI